MSDRGGAYLTVSTQIQRNLCT